MNFDCLSEPFSGLPPAPGAAQLSVDEAECLHRYALELQPNVRAVELGRTLFGSTLAIANALRERTRENLGLSDTQSTPFFRGGTLTSIAQASDSATDQLKGILISELRRLGLMEQVEFSEDEATRPKQPPVLRGPLGLLLVSGDGTYASAKRDHLSWGRQIAPLGIVIHRGLTEEEDLRQLRAEILDHQSDCVELLEEVGSLSIFKRKSAGWNFF